MPMNNTQQLAGKTALITGSAQGIGRGFAERFVREGARVVITDIDLDAAQKTASEIGNAAIAQHIDVTDQNSIDACVANALEAFGGIDILIKRFSMLPQSLKSRVIVLTGSTP